MEFDDIPIECLGTLSGNDGDSTRGGCLLLLLALALAGARIILPGRLGGLENGTEHPVV
jgi:hypothetical protein